jgi:hypothetical protein
MPGDVEQARVHDRDAHATDSLFSQDEMLSTGGRKPSEVCEQMGLNWLAAQQLHTDGWLSFDPVETTEMTVSQEAELTFVGRLVAAGCDLNVLGFLLADLEKPYAYRVDRLFYDWEGRCWDILPRYEHFRSLFQEWIEDLVDSGQLRKLQELKERLDRSIRDLHRMSPW